MPLPQAAGMETEPATETPKVTTPPPPSCPSPLAPSRLRCVYLHSGTSDGSRVPDAKSIKGH
ncbi:hypothetical protein GQ53DRAFT_755918 [Thozetella sp. PMI_491]|nr:hypothetical protein GQ53DRAFT_755918 [Thozetella sp. PMI_491]